MLERIINAMVAKMVENGWTVSWKTVDTYTINHDFKFRACVVFVRNDKKIEFSSNDVYSIKEMQTKIDKFFDRVEFLTEKGILG